MKLIWGIVEGEWKPMLFNADKLTEDEPGGDLLRLVNRKKERIKPISTPFILRGEKYADAILSWYGLTDYPEIIGRGHYEEVIF